MADTSIEWATHVWNPTTGCDRVSAGCDHCYALTMAKRLKGMGSAKYQRDGDLKTSGPGFGVTEHWDTLNEPFGWRKPRRVFVNSMSDLFHEEVSENFIAQVFAAMATTPKHTYMILTKRHARMRALLRKWTPVTGVPPWTHTGPWPLPNVWLGVSAEDQKWADIRIPALLETPAVVRFISAEPLLGPVILRDDWIGADPYRRDEPSLSWVIAGGESGPGARPMHPKWVKDLRDQCQQAGIAYHFKQWGEWRPQPRYSTDDRHHLVMVNGMDRGTPWTGWGLDQPDAEVMERVGKKAAGRELDGREWNEFPDTKPQEVVVHG